MTLDRQNSISDEDIANHLQHQTSGVIINNILIITQKHLELDLMKKSLKSVDGCKVYEAGNLKTAFNITSHKDIDLIIVDEELPTAEGFEIIDKLNSRSFLKEIPKILLITGKFKKERYDSYRDINLDFINKPIDPVMFKARISTFFKNLNKKTSGSSIFEEMVNEKIDAAKSFLNIYKSFLEVDENILFIYDHDKNIIVDANRVFLRFFTDLRFVNRVLQKSKYMKKYIPDSTDANYLNHYDFNEWVNISTAADGFHFGLTIIKNSTPYSFSVLLKEMAVPGHKMFVVKLLNNHNYLPQTDEKELKECRTKVNEELNLLKEEIDLEEKQRSYPKIYKTLKRISEYINGDDKENVLQIDLYKHQLVNVYFVIASLLKSFASHKTLYLNGLKVDKDLEENLEQIYLKTDPDALQDAVKGIMESYFTAPVQYDQRRIRVNVYTTSKKRLVVEIRASDRKEKQKESSMLDKILKKENLTFSSGAENEILPKNVRQAIDTLKADVKHYRADGHTIFLLTVPIVEKS